MLTAIPNCLDRKLEGGVSAVTKQITIQDKYQKQLAELDLMAEDWVDTDEVSPLPFLHDGSTMKAVGEMGYQALGLLHSSARQRKLHQCIWLRQSSP